MRMAYSQTKAKSHETYGEFESLDQIMNMFKCRMGSAIRRSRVLENGKLEVLDDPRCYFAKCANRDPLGVTLGHFQRCLALITWLPVLALSSQGKREFRLAHFNDHLQVHEAKSAHETTQLIQAWLNPRPSKL